MTSNLTTSKLPDADINQVLIERCKKGDQKAQFQIYKMYFKSMYNTSLRMVNDSLEAEDIMQESFITAFEKIESYPTTVSFGEWLKKIVINLCIETINQKRNVASKDFDISLIEPSYSIDDPTRESRSDLKADEIMEAIKRLPDACRIILSLHLLEGYNQEEVGELLSISPVMARTQLSQAKHMLLKELN